MIRNAKGTKDFYPEDEAKKQYVFTTLKNTAQRFGFLEVSAPVLETLDLLSRKQGEEIRNQIFTLEKKGTEELALRAEFTPSFARMFVQSQKQLTKPARWFCIDRVWRYERPQKGREREFYQFNVELLAGRGAISEAEIISLAIASLNALHITGVEVRINNRKLLEGIIKQFGGEDVESVLRIIDKKLKISEEEFRALLSDAVSDVEGIISFLNLTSLKDVSATHPLAIEGLKELEDLFALLKGKNITFSPSTARGLAYYTGIVFEIFDEKGEFRSLCGGGRYDSLIEQYEGEATPAVGFGMGYSTLNLFMESSGAYPKIDLGADYFVGSLDEDNQAFLIAEKLRENHSVVLNVIKRNLANQMKYANAIGAKNVLIIGSEEVAKKKVKVKNMKSGKEKAVTFADINSGKL